MGARIWAQRDSTTFSKLTSAESCVMCWAARGFEGQLILRTLQVMCRMAKAHRSYLAGLS